MNQSSPDDVINLPHIREETNTTKRNRSGNHVYMIHCRLQCKAFNYNQRKHLLLQHNIYTIEEYEKHEEHPRRYREPAFNGLIIYQVASIIWKDSLSPAMKQAWKGRADILNALPPYGQHTQIPIVINNHAAILNSLNYSFHNFVTYMHPLLKRDPRLHNDKMKPHYFRMFGKERVVMNKQMFCSFFLNHLLHLTFFGEWCNHSFLPFEVVGKTRNEKLVHIGSGLRLMEMTTINKVSPFQVDTFNRSQKYTENRFVAGKVILYNGITNAEVTGYVLNESVNEVEVKIDSVTANNDIIKLPRPKYNSVVGTFEYSNLIFDDYKWVSYSPIRLKIRRKGQIYFTINRIVCNKNDNSIVNI
jgi:hypothetical protein